MAEINIQRKKAAPGPWLLVLLLLLVLGAIAYFLLRPGAEATEEPAAPPASSSAPLVTNPDTAIAASSVPPTDENVAAMAAEEPTATADELASFAATQTSNSDYGRKGLRMLSGLLIDLADREDLRDASVSEKRDNLTSAISRLEETNTSIRPGCAAAAALMQAMQQKAYPQLERPVTELNEQALQLSGRTTENDQASLRSFFTKAAEIAQVLSRPATS